MDSVPSHFLGDNCSRDIEEIPALIPNNIKTINENAFENLEWSSIYIPGNVKTIKENAFIYSYIENIRIEEGVKEIYRTAFSYALIKELYLPDSIEHLGFRCFFNCENLVKLSVGNKIKNFNNYQFDLCTKLKDVTYRGTLEQLQKSMDNGNKSFLNCYELKEIKCTDGIYQI